MDHNHRGRKDIKIHVTHDKTEALKDLQNTESYCQNQEKDPNFQGSVGQSFMWRKHENYYNILM